MSISATDAGAIPTTHTPDAAVNATGGTITLDDDERRILIEWLQGLAIGAGLGAVLTVMIIYGSKVI